MSLNKPPIPQKVNKRDIPFHEIMLRKRPVLVKTAGLHCKRVKVIKNKNV